MLTERDVLRRVVEEGIDPVKAIQMATLNTAEHFKLDFEIGCLAPGRIADILVLRSLEKVIVETVVANGMIAAVNGRIVIDITDYHYPGKAMRTIRLHKRLDENDFKIRVDSEGKFKVRTIEVVEGKTITRSTITEVESKNGFLEADPKNDLSKVAVVERHKASGNIGLGFVTGFGFKEGAVASTVAHDSHNLLIVGTNDSDMSYAGNILSEVNGGIVAVKNGRIIALVELPIAGLMSNRPVQEVAEKVERLSEAWRKLGCRLTRPFMTMSLLALPVMPELRITDKGLIDTVNFRRIRLIAE
jgi:adenine deaminase